MSQYLFKTTLNDQVFYGNIRNWRDFFPAIRLNERYRTRWPLFTYDEIRFVKAAKTYIDAQRALYGVLAQVSVQIDLYNFSTNSWDSYITGKLAFDRYSKKNVETLVGIDPEDFVMNVLNNDELDLELTTTTDIHGNAITAFGTELEEVTLEAQLITRIWKAEGVPMGADVADGNPQTMPELMYYQYTPPKVISDDLKITNYNLPTGFNENTPVANFRLEEDGQVTITFHGTLTVGLYTQYDLDSVPYFKLHFILNDEAPHELYSHNFSQVSADTETVDIDTITGYSFPGSKGDEIGIYMTFFRDSGSDRPAPQVEHDDWGYTITQDTTFEDTPAKGMLIYEAVLRCLQKLTGRNDPLISTLLGRTDSEVRTYAEDGAFSLVMYTSGMYVRQFPESSYPLKATFYDLIKAINAERNIGVGVIVEAGVSYIVVEDIEYFWDNSKVAFSITDPKDLEETTALDYIFNALKFGPEKYEKEDNGTLGAPHTPRSYTTGLGAVVKNPYEFTQPAVTSSPVIELVRRDPYKPQDVKDNRYDTAMVLLALKRSGGGYAPEKGSDFTSISNLTNSDTYFNMSFTPRRALARHMNWIKAGGIQAHDQGEVVMFRFQSGEGNVMVESTKPGDPVGGYIENENVGYDEGDAPLFIANRITFKHPLTNAQMISLKSDPNQVVEVTWRGRTFEAFVEVDIENFESKLASFKLLEAY